MPRVIFLFGAAVGTERSFAGQAMLSRNASCTVAVDDASVSREHAKIVSREGEFFLQDLQSRNGTFLNGEKVVGEAKLNFGDEITLGKASLRFANEIVAEPQEVVLGEDVSGPSPVPAAAPTPSKSVAPSKPPSATATRKLVFRDDFAPKPAAKKSSLVQQDVSQYGGIYKLAIVLVLLAFSVGAFFAMKWIFAKVTATAQQSSETVEEK